jgi:hypothetical protein
MCPVENSTGIIAEGGLNRKRREAGGILHLPDALELYPERRLVLYNRTSGYGKQTGQDRSKLAEKQMVLYRAVRKLTDRPLKAVISIPGERGKLSAPRPGLTDAARRAWKLNAILVAYELSRFLRPEAYDPRTNPHAEPTADEYRQLHEMTGGVVLATVLPPWLSEGERHSHATRRTGRAGRPSSMTHDLSLDILDQMGFCHKDGKGRREWDFSMGGAAKWLARRTGKSMAAAKSMIQRLLDAPVPESICRRPGQRWKECCDPFRAYQAAYEEGLLPEKGPRLSVSKR